MTKTKQKRIKSKEKYHPQTSAPYISKKKKNFILLLNSGLVILNIPEGNRANWPGGIVCGCVREEEENGRGSWTQILGPQLHLAAPSRLVSTKIHINQKIILQMRTLVLHGIRN